MAQAEAQSRRTDSKGRITLGESFANRTMLIEHRGDEVVLRLARVIPEREAWVYENPRALGMLRKGLDQARKKQFVDGPDMDAARRLAARTPDSEG